MKSLRITMLGLFAAAMLVLVGCASFDEFVENNPAVPQKVQQAVAAVGTMAAPFTGGLSTLIAGVFAAAVPAAIAINRQIVAYRLAKALEKQHAAAAAVVQSFDAAKAAGGGTVDFNDPNIVQVLNTVQGEAGKALVDQLQG